MYNYVVIMDSECKELFQSSNYMLLVTGNGATSGLKRRLKILCAVEATRFRLWKLLLARLCCGLNFSNSLN